MTGFIVSVFLFRNRVSSKEAFEGLELGEGKLSRPVLRGPGGRKAAWLLGSYQLSPVGLVPTNVRALSDARLLQSAKLDAVLCARSISCLKVAAGGCGLMAMGILSFRPSVTYWFCGTQKMSMCENRNSMRCAGA